METSLTKNCNRCKITKTAKEFPKRKKNKDGLYAYCFICNRELHRNFNKTKHGLINLLYDNQKKRALKYDYLSVLYTKEQFKEWVLNQDSFNDLYKKWADSDYLKDNAPSVDRLDDYKNYSFDNIRLIPWIENRKKGNKDRRNGINNKVSKAVLQYDLNMNFIAEFYSGREAERQTGIFSPNISACCKFRYKQCNGYIWRYKDNLL